MNPAIEGERGIERALVAGVATSSASLPGLPVFLAFFRLPGMPILSNLQLVIAILAVVSNNFHDNGSRSDLVA